MEERIKQYIDTLPCGEAGNRRDARRALSLVRYADDLVVLHKNLAVVLKCKEIISEWLQGMGLELKSSKTRIAHTLTSHERQPAGFNFLGFKVKQHRVGQNRSKRGFKTIITPSKEKVKAHYRKIAEVINAHKSAPQKAIIMKLNPMIRGWANYYSTVCSKDTFSDLDYQLFQKLKCWAKHRHHKKTLTWTFSRYWVFTNEKNWIFALTKNGGIEAQLPRYSDTKVVRHIKVKGKLSPYDGDLIYWSTRLGKNPEMPKTVSTLLKKQDGKCPHCGLIFRETDVMEVDHIIPKSQGGRDEYKNLQLLHRHCHDTKSVHDKHQITEEPCEVNVSCTVLKTSR